MYQEWWLDLSTLFFFQNNGSVKKKQLRSQNSEVHRLAVQAKAMHAASESGATCVTWACLYHTQGCNVLNALNLASWGSLNLSSVHCSWCLIYVRCQKKSNGSFSASYDVQHHPSNFEFKTRLVCRRTHINLTRRYIMLIVIVRMSKIHLTMEILLIVIVCMMSNFIWSSING